MSNDEILTETTANYLCQLFRMVEGEVWAHFETSCQIDVFDRHGRSSRKIILPTENFQVTNLASTMAGPEGDTVKMIMRVTPVDQLDFKYALVNPDRERLIFKFRGEEHHGFWEMSKALLDMKAQNGLTYREIILGAERAQKAEAERAAISVNPDFGAWG